MKRLIYLFLIFLSISSHGKSSMRRCTLLPITDSVGGAIGYKLFEDLENHLKKSNWCTYVSNVGLINIFSRYRDSLPIYLKKKEVLKTVSDKLKVGSLILITLKNEISGVELEVNIFGEDGKDIYFSEKNYLETNDIESLVQTAKNWLDMFSKMIPYDARINGVLGDQITIDVGKGFPIHPGQDVLIKRLVKINRHPLLKKVVDWDTVIIAEGKIFNISDNQALAAINTYRSDKKILVGDWVKLVQKNEEELEINEKNNRIKDQKPGTLGILSFALFGSRSTVTTTSSTDSIKMAGNLYGLSMRAEGWITREYFAALEIDKSVGNLKKRSGSPSQSDIGGNNGVFKLTGGYKYLPIGFFYGPQIDIYTGYVRHTYNYDLSPTDGFGKNSISGIAIGLGVNVPLTREYRFVSHAEFIPFPVFNEDEALYGSAKSVNSMELELGIKYQYLPRLSIDGSFESLSNKANFRGGLKEVAYRDDRMKIGISLNF